MSDVIEAALAALAEKDTSSFEGSAKFLIEGEGAIIIDADGARAGDDEADVTLTASTETFKAILDGELNPTTAFMTGKLTVEHAKMINRLTLLGEGLDVTVEGERGVDQSRTGLSMSTWISCQ